MLTKLDTLAQLSTKDSKPPIIGGYIPIDAEKDTQQKKYQKKARAKATTNAVVFQLVDVKSPLTKSYWQSYHCNNIQLQEGSKITSKYCNQRWCLVCNRIRTAKVINGYSEPLSKIKEPQFVTLTIPNVPAKELKTALESMVKSFTKIRKNIAKTYGTKIIGIRKTECTYNPKRNDYHPHYHLIIEGKETAHNLVSLWLKQYPKADIKGQDIRPADKNSMLELAKYFTKVVNKDKFYPKQMDIVFRAMKGKRTFQPLGIKKDVSEDIDEIQSQEIDFKPNVVSEIWGYEKEVYDWVSASGETLTDYNPTEKDLEYFDKINNCKEQRYEQPEEQKVSNENNRETAYEAKQGNTALWYEAIHNHQDSIRQLLPRK